MAKKIQIDIEVNGKMQKAEVSAKKLRTALRDVDKAEKDAGKSARTLDRNLKGASQQSANGTKNFSKMAQGIGGKLVPAYATLAANVFAVTAAFNAFRKAAQIEQLETSLVRVGNIGGNNFRRLANELKGITGAAIDTEQALRTVATGTTQGFSGSQLADLTKIAKGASISLGRELPDALDRLVRGTAKLEPEILDELGIIVRLDEASRTYANSVGKTVNQLTQFEKQQAFANAVTEQGLKKFGEVAKSIEANPYDKLASTFGDLSKAVFEFLNKGLIPVVEFLSEKPSALVGVVALFASTIISQLTPALAEMAEESKERFAALSAQASAAAKKVQTNYSKALKDLKNTELSPAGFKKVEEAIRKGTASTKEFNTALKSLRASETRRRNALKQLEAQEKTLRGAQKTAHQMLVAEKKAELAMIESQISATKRLQAVQISGSAMTASRGAAQAANNTKMASRIGKREAVASGMMANAGIFGQFSIAGKAASNMAGDIGKATGALGKISTAGKVAAASMRLFGSAMLNAIPVIGQVLFFGTLLYEGLTAMFGDPFAKSDLEVALEGSKKALFEMRDAGKDVQTAMEEAANATSALFIRLNARTGFASQTAGQLRNLAATAVEGRSQRIKDAEKEQQKSSADGFFSSVARLFTESDLRSEARATLKQQGVSATFKNVKAEVAKLRQAAVAAAKLSESTFSGSDVIDQLQTARDSMIDMGFSETSAVIQQIDSSMSNLAADSVVTAEQLNAIAKGIDDAETGTRKFVAAFNEVAPALNQLSGEVNKLGAKASTPFTALATSSERVQGIFMTLAEGFNTLSEEDKKTFNMADALEQAGGGASEFAAKLRETPAYMEATGEEADRLNVAMTSFSQSMKDADEGARTLQSNLDKNKVLQEEAGRFAKQSVVFTAEQVKHEQDALRIRTTQNNKIIEMLKSEEQIKEISDYLKQLREENEAADARIAALANDKVRFAQAEFEEKKRLAQLETKIANVYQQQRDLAKQRLELDQKINLRKSKQQFGFDFIDQGRLEINQKIGALEAERIKLQSDSQTKIDDGKIAVIKAEYALIRARLKAEAEILRGKTDDPKAQASAAALEGLAVGLEGAESTAVENIREGTRLRIAGIVESINALKESREDLQPMARIIDGIEDSLTNGMVTAFDNIITGSMSMKDAFLSMGQSILKVLARIIAEMIAVQILQSAIGMFKPSGGIPTNLSNVGGSVGKVDPSSLNFSSLGEGFRYGGISKGYSMGGIANGPQAGYPATLHGKEAIVPLPNGNSIPVDMKGGMGQQNNVTVNVSTNGQTQSSANGPMGENLGQVIAAAVQKELQNQKRSGGLLNKHGVS